MGLQPGWTATNNVGQYRSTAGPAGPERAKSLDLRCLRYSGAQPCAESENRGRSPAAGYAGMLRLIRLVRPTKQSLRSSLAGVWSTSCEYASAWGTRLPAPDERSAHCLPAE